MQNIKSCTQISCTPDTMYHKHAQLGYDLNSNWINVHFTHFWQCSPQTCNHGATAFIKSVTQIPSEKFLFKRNAQIYSKIDCKILHLKLQKYAKRYEG